MAGRQTGKRESGGCLGCGLTLALFISASAAGIFWMTNEKMEERSVILMQPPQMLQELQLVMEKPKVIVADSAKAPTMGLYSKQAIMVELETGRVLMEKNSKEKTWPASITKLMTIIVAIERLVDLEQEITLSKEMFDALYKADASLAGFSAGEKVKAIDLLYGAMLPSGAEATIGLAEEIAGTEAKFAGLMNQKAKKLGMKNTHFVNVTGLHDPEHYSTAQDMAILLRYALKNDDFREIFTTSKHTTSPTKQHPSGVTFESSMFKKMSDPSLPDGEVLGGKTGYTGEAGLCLASLAQRNDREYILITLGAAGTLKTDPLYILDAKNAYAKAEEYRRRKSVIQMLEPNKK